MQIERAGLRQDAMHLHEARLKKPQVVVEAVRVRLSLAGLRPVSPTLEPRSVPVYIGGRSDRCAALRRARVEGRIGVDQMHGPVRDRPQHIEIVGLVDGPWRSGAAALLLHR